MGEKVSFPVLSFNGSVRIEGRDERLTSDAGGDTPAGGNGTDRDRSVAGRATGRPPGSTLYHPSAVGIAADLYLVAGARVGRPGRR